MSIKKLSIFLYFIFHLFSCSNSFDEKNGVKIEYFAKTKKIFKSIEMKDGKKNGVCLEYHRNGKLRAKQFYLNDELSDSSIFYFPDGKISTIQIVRNKKKEGCWKKYNKEGHLYSAVNFKDGVLDSTSTIYTYRTGKILSQINYKEGNKHGKQMYFYNNGKPKSVSYYFDDMPGLGTEEWLESGEKINNDFKISVIEKNKVLMENNLQFIVRLENPQEDDKVYWIAENDTGRVIHTKQALLKEDDFFLLNFRISRGGFVMEKVKLAAFRKTDMGNEIVRTTSFSAAANNY